jgi:hypothetical protein
MSRIRTVKPELFKHEDLFEAEITYKLPLRLAFIGLFTCCDRAGRFKWRPRRLKLDMLPYDNVDIVQVLEVLVTSGFVCKYEHQGEWYGCIPSWSKHQHLNHREMESELPSLADSIPTVLKPPVLDTIATNDAAEVAAIHPIADACLTSEARVTEPSLLCPGMPGGNMEYGIWKGREYGKEYKHCRVDDAMVVVEPIQEIFKHWQAVMKHPDAKLDHKRKALINKALSVGYGIEQICQAITGCSITPYNMGHNDRGQRYDGLHIILRDADQIDRFICNFHTPPQPIRVAEARTLGNVAALERWVNKKMQEGDNAKSRFN